MIAPGGPREGLTAAQARELAARLTAAWPLLAAWRDSLAAAWEEALALARALAVPITCAVTGQALAAGDTAEVVLRAADTAGRVLREGEVTVQFWFPGRWSGDLGAPAPDGPPDAEAPARWDAAARGWVALAPTAGWPAGRVLARGRFAGPTPRGPAAGSGWAELAVRAG